MVMMIIVCVLVVVCMCVRMCQHEGEVELHVDMTLICHKLGS